MHWAVWMRQVGTRNGAGLSDRMKGFFFFDAMCEGVHFFISSTTTSTTTFTVESTCHRCCGSGVTGRDRK